MLVNKNQSFVRLQEQIKSFGVDNVEYLTYIKNKNIEILDPFSPYLSDEEKVMIRMEALSNIWYFLSECVHVPVLNGVYDDFKIQLTSFESICAAEKGLNVYNVSPRQQYGTMTWLSYLLWNILNDPDYKVALVGGNEKDSLFLREKLIDLNGLLPNYIRMDYYELRHHIVDSSYLLYQFSDNDCVDYLKSNQINPIINLNAIFFDDIENYNSDLYLKVANIFKFAKDEKVDTRIYTKTTIGEKDTCSRKAGDVISEQCPRLVPDLYNNDKISMKNRFFIYINNGYKMLMDDHETWFKEQSMMLDNDSDLINREILCVRSNVY